MGGRKTKIEIKFIENKKSRAVTFCKRLNGLYSKTSELCLLSRAQAAVLATPVSSDSNASFYSFGHSSVDNVVSAFLSNQRPKDDLGLGFWWEEESLHKSEDSKELSNAVEAISRMLRDLKGLQSAAVEKKKIVSQGTHQELDDQNQALILHSSSSSASNDEAENQIVATSENNNDDGLPSNFDGFGQELVQNQALTLESSSPSNSANGVPPATSEGLVMDNEAENQIVAISDNNNNKNNALSGDNEEDFLDIDQLLNFDTESDFMNVDDVSAMNQNQASASEDVEQRAIMDHKDLDQDNLHFSDYFSF
ncbi:unnamed protein product [Cochlearia groenlandica]